MAKVRKRRTQITEEVYNNVKLIFQSVEKAGGSISNAAIGRMTNVADSTVGRIIKSTDYQDYKRIQRGKTKSMRPLEGLGTETPKTAGVKAPESSDVVTELRNMNGLLERIAVALEPTKLNINVDTTPKNVPESNNKSWFRKG